MLCGFAVTRRAWGNLEFPWQFGEADAFMHWKLNAIPGRVVMQSFYPDGSRSPFSAIYIRKFRNKGILSDNQVGGRLSISLTLSTAEAVWES